MTLKLPVLLLLLLLALAAAVGLFVGTSVDDGGAAPAAPAASRAATAPVPARTPGAEIDDSVPAAQVDALARRLQQEIETRRALERRLGEVERRLAAFSGERAAAATREQEAVDEAAETAAARAWFDEAALLESGMDSGLANELKVFFEQIELDRLYLRDRAAREGWERDRLREELRGLDDREQELKERLGETAYDAYLYASGQPNRVAVTSVLASAQAAQAGILPGDLIIRYDRERIYSWRDLRSATTGGNLAETVEVEVERDGDRLQFYLARGPLGIRMDSRSVAP